MERLVLCANPAASGFTGGHHRAVVARLRRTFEVTVEWPRSTAEARSISAAAASDSFDLVAAMGGDGVVHHVANGLGGTNTKLGIIPAGTTNVYARLLRIPSDPVAAAAFIATRPPSVLLPAAMLTLDRGELGVESRLATFSCGMGFDAAVVERAEREPYRKHHFAGLHYARSAAAVAWTEVGGRPTELAIRSRHRSAEGVAVFVALHDRYSYFGRLPIRFGNHLPGTLTALIAHRLSRRSLARIAGAIVTGRDLDGINDLEVWAGITSMEIEPKGETGAQADGELLGNPNRLSIATRDGFLKVLRPDP